MRVLFYGTPAFALPTLTALLAHHRVAAVVTQPDRPAGRGQRAHASPVKVLAIERGIPVLQPARLRDAGWPERLAEHAADVAVVVAFGQILPRPVLDVPPRGSINVHASLLPRYRGAAPIAWSIIRGERETGITTFQMDAGMDTGPLLLQRPTAIGAEETAGELAERLAVLGAEVLLETLARLHTPDAAPARFRRGDPGAAASQGGRPARLDGVSGGPGGAGTRAEPVARRGHPRARRPPTDLAGTRDRGERASRACSPWPTGGSPSGPGRASFSPSRSSPRTDVQWPGTPI